MSDKSSDFQYPLRCFYFYLTEGCNLNCRHCWISHPPKSQGHRQAVLDFGLFQSMIQQGKKLGLKAVKLTGGEPLIHPQIKEILEFVRNEQLILNLETNGTLCTPEIAKILAQCRLELVSVSLDGKDVATHEAVRRVKGSFASAKEGICNLVSVGIKPQVIMSLMRSNVDQIRDVANLVKSLGASSLKFNMIQPSARGEEMIKANETLTVSEWISLGEWIEREFVPSAPLPIVHSHPPAFHPLRRIFNSPLFSCHILSILGVLANGSYALCGIGETVPELVFGDARIHSLEDVWKNTPLLKEIREGLPNRLQGVCKDCVSMGTVCFGTCLAQNYNVSKNIWAPFWYCDEAYKLGLFPKSRLKSNLLNAK